MDRLGRRVEGLFRRGRREGRRSANVRRAVAGLALVAAGASLWIGAEALVVANREAADERGAPGEARRIAQIASARERTVSDPIDATPWLRLAWLESQGSEGLGASGNAALMRSYRLAPYGPEATLWRQAFIFDHWGQATPAVRERALDEMAAVYSRQGWDIEALAATIEDPTGRMVAVIRARRLRAVENLRQASRKAGP